MPLSFVNPALLFGSLAAALPVIIHFLSRRRIRRLPFSDLRFLDEVQASQARSLGIRRWLLLLLRVLAILLLTLALAGPRWGGMNVGSRDRAMLFVIDASASMGTQTDRGTRLDEAVAACREMIAALPGGTQVQVLTASGRCVPLFGDWLPAGTVPPEAFTGIEGTDGPFDLAAVLREAADRAAQAPAAGMDLVLLSDLQKVRDLPDLGEEVARLDRAGPVGVMLAAIGRETDGGAVFGVSLPGRALRSGETVSLEALVRPEYPDQVFTLELDGRPLAEAVAAGPAAGVRSLPFTLTVPEPGSHRGLIRKESDRFPADDARPFVLEVPRDIPVVLAHGRDLPADGAQGRGGWRILQQAFAPGSARSLFRVRDLESAELSGSDLRSAALLVLVDPDPLGRTALESLAGWLDEGGALLLVVGDPARQAYLEAILLPLLGLPAEGVRFRAGPAGGGREVKLVGSDHPVCRGFDREALGTLEEIRWRRYFELQEGPARVILTLVGGSPLLMEGEVGRGRFALLAGNLRPENGTAAGSSMLLPFLQRLGSWLAAGALQLQDGNLEAGDVARYHPALGDRAWDADLVAGVTADLPGAETRRPVALAWQGPRPVLDAGIVARAGFVTFLAGEDTVGVLAVAVPGEESGLKLHPPREWRALMRAQGLDVRGDLSGVEPAAFAAALAGSDLTPWFLLAAVLVLLVEMAVGRSAGPGKPAPAG